MTGADPPSRAPHTLFSFNSQDDLRMYATGCDADIGGNSTVNLDLDEASTPHTHTRTHNARTKHATAKFWGDMRLDVRPQYQGRVRGGYAAFRNKVKYHISPLCLPTTTWIYPICHNQTPSLIFSTLSPAQHYSATSSTTSSFTNTSLSVSVSPATQSHITRISSIYKRMVR